MCRVDVRRSAAGPLRERCFEQQARGIPHLKFRASHVLLDRVEHARLGPFVPGAQLVQLPALLGAQLDSLPASGLKRDLPLDGAMEQKAVPLG